MSSRPPDPCHTTLCAGCVEPIPKPPEWVEQASCAGLVSEDHDPWFPVAPQRYTQARRICNRCPVRADCLEYALTYAIGGGMYGGRTPEERRVLAAHLGYRLPTISPVLRAAGPEERE